MIPVFKFIVAFLLNISVFLSFDNISQSYVIKKINFSQLILSQ